MAIQPAVSTNRENWGKLHHPDVVPAGRRAYLIYFTHPGRGLTGPGSQSATSVEWRRSSLQIAELRLGAGRLRCDRDAATYVALESEAEPVGSGPVP